MTTDPKNIFDNREFLVRFLAKRREALSLNNQIDQPTILGLAGLLSNQHVLEIGCGAGDLACCLTEIEGISYSGIDISGGAVSMAADRVTAHSAFKFFCADVEVYDLGEKRYNVVISALTFHFLRDLRQLFGRIKTALMPGGLLVFSMRHPIRTSNPSGGQQDQISWLVREYFDEGPREIDWHGQRLTIYHRTFSSIVDAIFAAGLVLLESSEVSAQTGLTLVEDRDHIAVPGFIYFKCQRPLD